MVHIIIADTHALYREALCAFIRNCDRSLEVTGTASLDGLTHIAPADFLLMDASLAKQVLPSLAAKDGRIAVIYPSPEDEALAGNHGVFFRKLSSKSIYDGVRKMLAGEPYSPNVESASAVAQGDWTGKRDFPLTTREREVLSHLVHGESNKEIARAMSLQVVTVKLHVRGICRKMKVTNRTQAALMAKDNGFG